MRWLLLCEVELRVLSLPACGQTRSAFTFLLGSTSDVAASLLRTCDGARRCVVLPGVAAWAWLVGPGW